MDIEAVPSMWPEDIGDEPGKQFNIESGGEQDMLEQVTIPEKQTVVDFQWLSQLTNFTDKGSAQLAHLVKRWEYKQANVVRLLKEEIDSLSRQRHESELKELEILEEHRFEEKPYVGDDKRQISLEDIYDMFKEVPAIVTRNNKDNNNAVVQKRLVEVESAEFDTVMYWKQRAMSLEKLLEASIQREQILKEKLHDSINNLERESSPVEDLNQLLHRADNFLHFILQHAPIVIGHQDKELRYRFIYNHFPSLHEEDIIGKTDVEIFTGAGVKENQEFKREVLEKGLPAKREVTFETELFGSKTFLIYVEPVFNKAGEIIGINYVGMEVTDQVKKREKMIKLREEVAVQKAKETELNKTIHITEETMRAKQMLATMSHEIRSPLSGVVSMTEILATTKLDREQRQLLDVMLSSGDLVLQLINDILDLSKVESGVMKLEATKFRPREVVKHVLQTAAASLKKSLTLEGHISDEVPIEVIGDVLRIRQILTNLISNAIKFTHQGKVGIKLYLVPQPPPFRIMGDQQGSFHHQRSNSDQYSGLRKEDQKHSSTTNHHDPNPHKEEEEQVSPAQTTVWIRCDVYDTGIGIPENALPTLFTKYMQVSADHARKYGGTGLGLAICKQLVELMGGRLTVSSNVNVGSTFTFVLPYNVSPMCDSSTDDIDEEEMLNKAEDDITAGYFKFQPRTLGFSSNGKTRSLDILPLKLTVEEDDPSSYMFPTDNLRRRGSKSKETAACSEDGCSVIDVVSDGMSGSECSPSQSQSPIPIPSPSPCNNKDDVVLKGSDEAEDDQPNNKINGEVNIQGNSKAPPELSSRSSSSSSSSASKLGGGGDNARWDLEKGAPRILLVEDNKINVMVTQSMMKQFGQKMDVVNNGVEAVRAVQHRDYDLVLMDVCMPIMDGLQATRLIRSFEETGSWDEAVKAGIESPSSTTSIPCSSRKRLPIIAMTANALSESAEECFMNGMDSFVSKPVTFLKLKQCLEQYLP